MFRRWRTLGVLSLLGWVVWGGWLNRPNASDDPEKKIAELIQNDSQDPGQSLASAFQQAAELQQRQNQGERTLIAAIPPKPAQAPVIEQIQRLDPELAQTFVAQGEDPEQQGDTLLSFMQKVPPTDHETRGEVLRWLSTDQEIPGRVKTQIALRELELPTPSEIRDDRELDSFRIAVQLAAQNSGDEQKRARILQSVRDLHPSAQAQAILEQSLGSGAVQTNGSESGTSP